MRTPPFDKGRYLIGLGEFTRNGDWEGATDNGNIRTEKELSAAVAELTMRLIYKEQDPAWREKIILTYGFVTLGASNLSHWWRENPKTQFSQYDGQLPELLESFSFRDILRAMSATHKQIQNPQDWVSLIATHPNADPRIIRIAAEQGFDDAEFQLASSMPIEYAIEFYSQN